MSEDVELIRKEKQRLVEELFEKISALVYDKLYDLNLIGIDLQEILDRATDRGLDELLIKLEKGVEAAEVVADAVQMIHAGIDGNVCIKAKDE
jgi:hypothetical protein